MFWLDEFTTSIGLPVVGAVLARAIYKGAAALDGEINESARRRIAIGLRAAPLRQWALLGDLIRPVFGHIFGHSASSQKFFFRSIMISVVFVCLSLIYMFLWGTYSSFSYTFGFRSDPLIVSVALTISIVLFLLVPGYVSLWKSRILLFRYMKVNSAASSFLFFLIDIFFSFIISCICAFSVIYVYKIFDSLIDLFGYLPKDQIGPFPIIPSREPNSLSMDKLIPLFYFSTMLTSAWTFLTLISILVLKILIPLDYLRRGSIWLLDVDNHPIRSLGIVAGCIVWGGSSIVALIRLIV